MYDLSKTVSILKPRTAVWAYITDIDKWPVWDVDVERVEYSGTQFLGTKGKLFMKNKKVFDFTVDTVRDLEYFSYTVSLPGASTKWYWELTLADASKDDTQLKMGVQISGFMGWLYSRLLKTTLEIAFKDCTDNLIKMV